MRDLAVLYFERGVHWIFHFDLPDRQSTPTAVRMQWSSQVFECRAFPTAAAKISRPKTDASPTHSSNAFPSPVSLSTEICFGLRLVYPAGDGSAAILRSMAPNSRRVR